MLTVSRSCVNYPMQVTPQCCSRFQEHLPENLLRDIRLEAMMSGTAFRAGDTCPVIIPVASKN